MKFIPRSLGLLLKKSKKSVLVLGPRQTGKSTLMRSLDPELTINLALEATFLDFARNPRELGERMSAARYRSVLIDEVQRLPRLLNTVQAILDETPPPPKFYLTGSSARKLRRGKANLLPGRIHAHFLGPFTSRELGYRLDTQQALSTGTLPGIWTEKKIGEREKTLRSYASIYLKEEIQAEAVTQSIEGFSRFLFIIGAEAGKFLDLAKLASQASVPRQSAVRYFEILEDTLIVRRCEAFGKSPRRRLIQRPRFFFFDTGVLNGLLGNFVVSADRIGPLFEHLVFNQLIDSAAGQDQEIRLSSYRTEHGAEIDFIMEKGKETFAIEIKASRQVGKSDLRGFESFQEYYKKPHRRLVAYLGESRKLIKGVEIFPWQELLREVGL